MRASRINLTVTPFKFFEADKDRGIFIFRNRDAGIIAHVQFGKPGGLVDFFDVLPGDTLTLDRGDLTQEIYLFADTANSNNQTLVG